MAIKTFLNWLKENKFEVEELADQPEKKATDADQGEKTTRENRLRTGWSPHYPPAYASAQYPNKYMNPVKATADLDKENMDKGNVTGKERSVS